MKSILRVAVLAIMLAGFTVEVVWAAPPAQGGGTRHVISRGEILHSIARRYGTTVQAIVQANAIANPNRIYVGQVLIIPMGSHHFSPTPTPVRYPARSEPTSSSSVPSSSHYTVRSGDTLSAIARRFGTTASAIARANNIRRYSYIYPGQKLIIPASPVYAGSKVAPSVPSVTPTPTPSPPWPTNWPYFP